MVKILLLALIYKPLVLTIIAPMAMPHVAFLILSTLLAAFQFVKFNKYPKYIFFIFIFLATAPLSFIKSALFIDSYIYNYLFIINFALLFCMVPRIKIRKSTIHYCNLALFICLLVSVLLDHHGSELTKFKGRQTLIGYDNPLWAARDLVIIALFNTWYHGKISVYIICLLTVVIFVLEARGTFLTFLILALYNGSISRILVLTLTALMSVALLVSMNRYSLDYRLFEWSNIISNLDQIPIFGFGVQQYQYHTFTSNLYAHNWVLDYILGFGVIGGMIVILNAIGIHKLLKNKKIGIQSAILSIPAVYCVNGLTQGDVISSLLGVVFLLVVALTNFETNWRENYDYT